MCAYTVLVPLMAVDLGLSLAGAFGVLCGALIVGGLAATIAGHAIDRFGGRRVMSFGAVGAAVALFGLGELDRSVGLFAAVAFVALTELHSGKASFSVMAVISLAALAALTRVPNPTRGHHVPT